MAAKKKLNTGSVSTSLKEPKTPKLTTDTVYKYLQMMGGEPVIVKPDGKQATKGKFAFGQDVGLNNEFTKLPEIHTRFDDPKIALMVAKELATGQLTVGMQRNAQTGEVETVTKQYEPIPSRGNTAMRQYGLENDPTGRYLAFNKPEEAYKAPKSYKELQADARKIAQREVLPIAPEPVVKLNPATDTGGWANAVGEPYATRQPEPTFKNQEPRFRAEMGNPLNPTALSDRGAYNRAKTGYEGYQELGYAPKETAFPDFYDLQRQAKSEGVRPDAFQNYVQGKLNAPLIESGVISKPELPLTARIGQEYISPKTGNVGAVESVGKQGVKLNVDGQVVPVKYETLERLKYTGNKDYGFGRIPALAAIATTGLGVAGGWAAGRALAKSLGMDEDQQNIAGTVGGVTGGLTGAIAPASLDYKLAGMAQPEFRLRDIQLPTAQEVGKALFTRSRNPELGMFRMDAIAPDVREKIKTLPVDENPFAGMFDSLGGDKLKNTGINLYNRDGSTTGINAVLREQLTGMDRHVADYNHSANYDFVRNLQSDLEITPTKPQITYRGMVEGATDFQSGYKGAGGSGERLAESIGLKPNKTYYDKAFMATTPNRGYADRYGKDIILEVMGSAGYKMPTRHADMGGEVLYPAGNQFDVENYRVDDQKVTARLVDRNLAPDEVVSLKQSLLKRSGISDNAVQVMASYNKQFTTYQDAAFGRDFLRRESDILLGKSSEREYDLTSDYRERFPSNKLEPFDVVQHTLSGDYRKSFTDKTLREARRSPDYAGKFQESAIALKPDTSVIDNKINQLLSKFDDSDPFGLVSDNDDAVNRKVAKLEAQKQSILESPSKQSFEYGQKFQSPRSGASGSLVSVDGQTATLQGIDGKQKVLPISTLKNDLQIKAPATLTDLKRGDGLIANKSDQRYTVMGTTADGVELRGEDGTIKTARKSQVPDLFRANSLGFAAPPALRPILGGFAGGTLGAIAFKQLAKYAGLNEDQQNIAAGVGGATGAITGGSLSAFKPSAELKAPTARQFAQTMMGVSAPSQSGMFLTAEGRNKMRLNQLNQYDIKPVLGEAAVFATDLLTPRPYGVATVPAVRMATDAWKNNFDAIAERGMAAMRTSTSGATSAIKDFTYQTLSQLGRSAGLPFPMTEQIVGNVVDQIPNSQQIMSAADRAKARLSRRFGSELGMVMLGDRPQTASRQSTGTIFEVEPRSLSDLQKARAKLDVYNPDAKPIQAIKEFKPVAKLSLNESAAMQAMKPDEYKSFQQKIYEEVAYQKSQPFKEASERIAQVQFKQQQTYFDAMKAWNKASDPSVPMPRKQDFAQPMKRTFDMQSTLSEASVRAKKATTGGFGKVATKGSNFIAESAVESAAKASGATTQQVKAQIVNQRAAGETLNLSKATEAIAASKKSNELAIRSTPDTRSQSRELAIRQSPQMSQSKELSTRVSSRQTADGMIATSSQSMINAGMKQQKIKIGDRIGATGLGILMDTSQAANVLTESASRGENTQTALTRAGVSVGAGYATTALASFVPNPYLRTALQLGGGIAAVVGADKLIDQAVGRNEAKEQKYAKDLSKLDLQPTNEAQQWKPFANDDNGFAAYGNAFTAQIQSNLDYRPAGRSLANLANRDSIENARYQSEREVSVKTGMDAKSNRSIAYEDRGNGVTEGIMRQRGYTGTESRILALQNLANESGYEVARTGKFDGKTFEALEKLGYGQKQIRDYIQGATKAIGYPAVGTNESNQKLARETMVKRSQDGKPKITSGELSQALRDERKTQGLKGGQMLDQGAVDGVFKSLAGKSLSELRQSNKVGGKLTQSALRIGAGVR